jgi:hypothetical protein
MIDIDLSNPIDIVRANIGDIDREWVSDGTINGALVAYTNNVYSTSIALMNMLCTYFSTLADREKVGEVEEYYTKLFERYKQRLEDFKSGSGGIAPTAKAFMPIWIGGTSKSEKQRINELEDGFSMYDMADYHNRMVGNKSLFELVSEDLEYALYQSH